MITEDSILTKLRNRNQRGPIRLSYAEADWLIDLIENPVLTRKALRVLIDQAKRTRMNSPAVSNRDPSNGQKYVGRPKPPVLELVLE